MGDLVHVAVHDPTYPQPFCRPAIVMAVTAGGSCRLRVILQTPVGQPVGAQDGEGWYGEHPGPAVANPDGTTRQLDAWHIGPGSPGCMYP